MSCRQLDIKISIGFRSMKGLVLFIFLMLSVFSNAQTYPTRQYTVRDGLPGISIQSIYKDSQGLMWIGTNAGLCTYDGNAFKVFKHSEGMTANEIWAIAEDDQGNMWFGSYGQGLYKYDGNVFSRYTKAEGLFSDKVRTLCWSDNFRCLAVGGQGGMSIVRGDSIVSSPPEVFTKESGSMVTGLTDAGEYFYVTTFGNNNPIRYYPDRNEYVLANTENGKYPKQSFSVFISSKSDTVFSDNHFGVSIYQADGQIVQDLSMGQIFSIAEDKRGDLWLASWSYPNRDMVEGIFRYDGETFRNYKAAFGITDLEIWTVFYDEEQDILWIGTLNEGLFMVPFTHIEQFPPSYFNLEQQNINGIYVDSKNFLWIAGINQLIRMDLSNGAYSVIDKHQVLLAVKRFWDITERKTFNNVLTDSVFHLSQQLTPSMIVDLEKNMDFNFQQVRDFSDNSVLFTNCFGIFEYNIQSEKIDFLGPEGATDFFELAGKDTVVFTGRGHTAINTGIKCNYPFFEDSTHSKFNEKDEPHNIIQTKSRGNEVWYASTTSGLWTSEGMSLINHNIADSSINLYQKDVCFDNHDYVFFGSNSGVISIAHYANQKLMVQYRIGNDQGLYGNSIAWLEYDSKGYLWVGTNLGLNCIDLADLYDNGNYSILFFDEEDGYGWQSTQKTVIDKSGNIWIGDFDHLVRLDTKGLLSKDVDVGRIYLKSFEINNVPFDSMERKFSHSENDLIFQFDMHNYRNRNKDLFRHKLLGYDDEWFSWTKERKVVYTNLPPGNYELIIESRNIQTLNEAEPFVFKFRIKRPWWGIWYLQLLSGLLVMSLLLYIFWRNTESKRKKQQAQSEVEKTILELEMQALQAQMNPHFIFNCITGIQYYVHANQMDQVLVYLADFSKVVRGSLENATTPMVSLEKEIEFLKSYLHLEEMRFEDQFDYEFVVTEEELNGVIQLPPMFIQPFVENSIRHGFMRLAEKGHLLIRFEPMGSDVLKCTITDNGIGRKKSAEKKTIKRVGDRLHSGLITESRIKLFNTPGSIEKYKIIYTDLEDQGKASGLKVEIYLPMLPSNYIP